MIFADPVIACGNGGRKNAFAAAPFAPLSMSAEFASQILP